MAVSSDFLSSLDVVMVASDEPCTCEKDGWCKRCAAEQLIGDIYTMIESFREQHDRI